MMWSAGFSDSNVINGCTYAQQAHAILSTGQPCVGGPTTTTKTAVVAPTPTTSKGTSTVPAATSTATGTVAQWGQVCFYFLSNQTNKSLKSKFPFINKKNISNIIKTVRRNWLHRFNYMYISIHVCRDVGVVVSM